MGCIAIHLKSKKVSNKESQPRKRRRKDENQDKITFNQNVYQSFNSFGKYDYMDNDVKYTVLESNNNVMDSNWNGIVKYKYEN